MQYKIMFNTNELATEQNREAPGAFSEDDVDGLYLAESIEGRSIDNKISDYTAAKIDYSRGP